MGSLKERVVSIQEAIVQNLELRAQRNDFQGFVEIIRDSQKLTKVDLRDVGSHLHVNMATVYPMVERKEFSPVVHLSTTNHAEYVGAFKGKRRLKKII